jgi:predicted MPP superfamily phosphohydrolase
VISQPAPRRTSRRQFLKALRNVAAGYALAGAGAYVYGARLEANWLSVRRVTIPVRGLPAGADGLRLVQLSDFHLYPITQLDHLRRAVDEANRLRPDLVLLTGDYVTVSADHIFELAPVLAGLNAAHGVFAALGNHDLWTNAAVVRQGLEASGIPVLVNQGLALPFGREALYVAGLDDGWSGHPDLAAALARCPAGARCVVMMHEPDLADGLAADPRLALQLSGHSHGGQVRVPGLGALILPPLGRKYDYGLYRIGDMWLYTNPGLGASFPGLRLNCRPEVTEITLAAV